MRKIHTTGQPFPLKSLDCWTSDGQCLTVWAKPMAAIVGLKEPSRHCIASLATDNDGWHDIVVDEPVLTRDNVTKALNCLYGEIVLV